MKHRRYTYQDRPAEIDLPTETPRKRRSYRVTCRRRTTPGRFWVHVDADSPEEAKQLVRDGKAQPGVGLGWIPIDAVELGSDTAPE